VAQPLPENCFRSWFLLSLSAQAAIREAYRVLKKGGRMLILEFSHVQNPLLGQVYDQFSFNVIPKMGQLVANDAPSYQYLVESIRRFPKQVRAPSAVLIAQGVFTERHLSVRARA
jgi:ubiquinone/menaquinone biosynthesis C-methylase UbiE